MVYKQCISNYVWWNIIHLTTVGSLTDGIIGYVHVKRWSQHVNGRIHLRTHLKEDSFRSYSNENEPVQYITIYYLDSTSSIRTSSEKLRN